MNSAINAIEIFWALEKIVNESLKMKHFYYYSSGFIVYCAF